MKYHTIEGILVIAISYVFTLVAMINSVYGWAFIGLTMSVGFTLTIIPMMRYHKSSEEMDKEDEYYP